ncbi:MAG: acyl-CoA dehydrogenase [Reyranellaceae bacterium]
MSYQTPSSASFVKSRLSAPIYRWAKTALPRLSATERDALEAGDVWWDAELFTGSPDWRRLLDTRPAALSAEEREFLDGPVRLLCAMLDDWKINWELGDLPPEVWDFLKTQGFFGMIIPKEFGGLGFSAYAHSEVVRTVSTRSIAAAVTVMVPNSLGPGELLMQFGTDEQRRHWLPRLADGREIPCFSLTSPQAGSDAAAMTDKGVVVRREGSNELAIRLNWHKRYITLGPVATVMGLAFKLEDPDRLLGGKEDIGITVALVPTDAPGVEIGERHLPSMQNFQNGPNRGVDVVLPLSAVIGGESHVGQGWKMLMSALAVGRGISLPSLSAAGAALTARSTGAYAGLRRQFGIEIGRFEGVQEKLASLAANAYALDAARRLTCAGLDEGRKLAVISAILKYHATERMRQSVNDAMDVHAGKAVIDGPRNYLGSLYRAIPIGITVEGANIMTRNLMIYGQGAIRCHPYLLEEILALEAADPAEGLERFHKAFWGHVGHAAANVCRALLRGWSGGRLAPGAGVAGIDRHFRMLGRYAAAFALLSDLSLLTLGGSLKFREMLSARLGDILSELYLLSAVLKRWLDEGAPGEDLALVDYAMASGEARMAAAFAGVLRNHPARWAAGLVRLVAFPFGFARLGPDDRLAKACAAILLEPSPQRDRLTPGIYSGQDADALAVLERALVLAQDAAPLRRRLREAKIDDIERGLGQGVLSAAEADRLRAAEALLEEVIAVDAFAPDELSPARPSRS